jgi:hypothetical protein
VAAGNVYTSWPALFAAATAVQGPKVIQIDDSIVSPAVIPAGTYDLLNISLSGNENRINNNQRVVCNLDDGVVFLNFASVTNFLTLVSLSTSVPVWTTPATPQGSVLLLTFGGGISNSPGSTVPFVHVPPAGGQIFALALGGEIGPTGTHVVQIDAGAGVPFVINDLASLANDVFVGGGQAQVIVSSQGAFINTPFPILQPAIASLFVQVFSFADRTSITVNGAQWVGAPPANVEDAINRMATALNILIPGPIP